MKSLRVSHNPLYNSLQAADGRALSAEDGYMLTLARLGNLKSLNYSPITDKERLNAESYYLSIIARELNFSPLHMESQILESHPRYAYLCSEYGEPAINRSATAINPNSLAARLMRLKFYWPDGSKEVDIDAGNQKYEIEIPRSSTAYTVLGLVARNFGIPPMKCKMTWETGDWMLASRAHDDLNEDWDSESSDEDGETEPKTSAGHVMREVEIVPGTRAVGNWIEGKEAVVRIDIR